LGQLNSFLLRGTCLGLPFCLIPEESPFFLWAFSLKKLFRGAFFFIHFVRGRINFFKKKDPTLNFLVEQRYSNYYIIFSLKILCKKDHYTQITFYEWSFSIKLVIYAICSNSLFMSFLVNYATCSHIRLVIECHF